jgi:voltage-gated potassium channel
MTTMPPIAPPPGRLARLRPILRGLYHGRSPQAIRFRLGVLAVDFAIIAFFIVAPLLRETPVFLGIDYAIAALMALDLTARALSWRDLRAWIRRPIVWVDLFVLATLLAPQWLFNLGFLRIVRLWSLFHSEFFWSTVGRRYDDTRWEDVVRTLSTLVTFIFVVTGFVYTGFRGIDSGIAGYIDALYFTVATLTTTGFGDITLPGPAGKLLSIVTMIVGISLFARLAQTLFRPNKVRFDCPTCGLQRHDPDAVHCKACGTPLKIPNADH